MWVQEKYGVHFSDTSIQPVRADLCQLDSIRVIWEEESSNEKMPLSDWPVVCFINYCFMWEGSAPHEWCHPLGRGPGYCQKAS